MECSHLEGCGPTVVLTVCLMGVIKDRLTVTSFTDYLPASGFVLKCLKTFKKEESINHKEGGKGWRGMKRNGERTRRDM